MKTKRLFGKTFLIRNYRNGTSIIPLENLTVNEVASIFNYLRSEKDNRPVKGEWE